MAQGVYLTAIEPGSGKSAVALGMMELLSRLGRVGYFRPVIASADLPDPDVELIRGRYRLAQSYEESYAVTMAIGAPPLRLSATSPIWSMPASRIRLIVSTTEP